MYRKSYEVTGYAPQDGGYILCVSCHANAFPDHNPSDCECGTVFLSTETDCVESCDQCGEEVETAVLAPEEPEHLKGYHDCPCRDCFNTAIGATLVSGEWVANLCSDCEDSGCSSDGDSECESENAYGATEED